MDEKWQQLKDWINESDNIVFFGGAGVSTESGIPDFRSVDGLYHQKFRYPPETILSHTFYERHKEEFFDFYRQKLIAPEARPNAAHVKLAQWERDGKLKAVITDGDIRKFFLRGGTPDQTVDNAANYHPLSVSVAERGKARGILQKYCIDALPVLNKRGIITDIIFAHGLDVDNRKQVDIPVVMMAGGLGTRLYPYTKILPKPLIPVGEQPIAEMIMDRFRDFGCHDFTMIVNYKKGMIKSYFNELEKDYHVDFADEDVFMGTGGGLCLLKGKIGTPFFFTNCDTLLDVDFGDIYEYHRAHGNLVTMICAFKHYTVPYGVVELGEDGGIAAMREKPELDFLTNTGVYVVEPRVVEEMRDGEFIGLIGHTGSGKSTLVQHLNGLILPTSGKITVDGMDLAEKGTDRRAIRRRVGLVFQYPENQLFEETVAKDIAFGPKNLGLDEAEIDRRVRTAMRRVALDYDKLAQRSVFELSGGQMRRVAIAGVLAMEPQTLVLDEPCAGLDPRGREEILGLISDLHRESGATIVMVSHSMEEIASNVDRLLVMNHGQNVMNGTPAEVFSHAEELVEMGLAIPKMTQLFLALKRRGVPVDTSVFSVEQARQALRPLLKGGRGVC